jgi:hypothetical protein
MTTELRQSFEAACKRAQELLDASDNELALNVAILPADDMAEVWDESILAVVRCEAVMDGHWFLLSKMKDLDIDEDALEETEIEVAVGEHNGDGASLLSTMHPGSIPPSKPPLTKSTFLSAVIESGPNEGKTIAECITANIVNPPAEAAS